MSSHDDLRGALRRQASGLPDDHPLTVDDVKGRARGIRRRRIAVSGLAAAAVVALAVPVGLSVGDDAVSGPEVEPAAPTETVAPPPDPTGLLLTTDRPLGEVPPGIDYLYDDEIVVAGADGSPVVVGPYYYGTAPLGDGWAALRSSDEGEVLDVIDAAGRVTATHPATGGLALSEDGTVLAYGAPGGRVMTLVAGEEPQEIYDGDGPVSPVAVIGSESCDNEAAGGGCAVYVNDELSNTGLTVTTKGIVGEIPGVRKVSDVSPAGWVAGVVSADDYGSCSAMFDVDGTRAWKTCEHTLGEFSPDGRYVIGYPSYRDGAGDSSLAVIETETGEVLTEVRNDDRTQAFVSGPRWDVDGTVLMPVHQDGTWALMRLTPEGQLVRAEERDFSAAEPYVSDLSLSVRP